MKINYVTNSIEKLRGLHGNISGAFKLKKSLELPTIDYEEYKKIYLQTLSYCVQNVSIFEEFYNQNQELYKEVATILDSQSTLIKRFPRLRKNESKC